MPEDDARRRQLLKLVEQLSVLTALLKEILARDQTFESSQHTDETALATSQAASLSARLDSLEGDVLRRYFLAKSAAEINEARHLTNDIIEIRGGFGTTAKQIQINSAQISLTRAEFLVAFVLASHARTLDRLPSPRRVDGGPFLSVEEILREVDSLRAEEASLAGFWSNATFSNIHRTIWELRRKLLAVGANPNLIQSGPPGDGGYRFSTPPFNITIALT